MYSMWPRAITDIHTLLCIYIHVHTYTHAHTSYTHMQVDWLFSSFGPVLTCIWTWNWTGIFADVCYWVDATTFTLTWKRFNSTHFSSLWKSKLCSTWLRVAAAKHLLLRRKPKPTYPAPYIPFKPAALLDSNHHPSLHKEDLHYAHLGHCLVCSLTRTFGFLGQVSHNPIQGIAKTLFRLWPAISCISKTVFRWSPKEA